jgi:YacP-like NYN domain
VSPRGPGPVVLVDAPNVIRSRWPNIRPDRFLRLVGVWAEREGVEALVVFDGTAPAKGLGTHVLDARTTVVGTGRGSADDWIVDEARRLAGGGRRVRVVSSDRELRDRVGPYVERVVGGGSFAALLERLERDVEAAT